MRVTDRGGQLAFPLRLEGLKHFENFHTGANTELVSRLEALVAARGTLGYWLWGQAGRGRSHLLQASCQHAEQLGYRAAYLPLDLLPRDSLILDGLETDLFLVGHPEEIDDVSAVPIINNGNFHGYSAPV